jgi:cell division protein FtsB
MKYATNIKNRIAKAFAPALIMMALIYFGLHSSSGLVGLKELEGEAITLEALAHDVRAERLALETKISQLRPDNIEPDMLDERARRILGFSGRDEVVLLNK